MEQWIDSKLEKEYVKALYCHPAYLTCMQSASCEMPNWISTGGIKIAVIKISGRNINNLRYADETTLMAESKEELKSVSMRVKEKKADLKLNIQKTKIMASGPITSWQIVRKKVETVTDFIFLGSKITADGDCSHEIKRLVLLGRQVMTNLDSILKNGDITLLTKFCMVKAMLVIWM